MRKVALQWMNWRKLEISNLSLLETLSSSTYTSFVLTHTTENQQNQKVGFHCTAAQVVTLKCILEMFMLVQHKCNFRFKVFR